ncbi:unnamed protein product [Lactuca saligna]|uniref:Topo IIA-type catalytic domain-containing protein n=1 Tax=Lactuca saligna TaxID=75948 RepID=A0AA35YTJ7_LACSI|nr:unnamed protein product [Lactuca saligna]
MCIQTCFGSSMYNQIQVYNIGELEKRMLSLITLKEMIVLMLKCMQLKKDVMLQKLLEYMARPDFPTGGIIMGVLCQRKDKDISIRFQNNVHYNCSKRGYLYEYHIVHNGTHITYMNYQTNKSSLVKKIVELIQNKTGNKYIVTELKRWADPPIILNNLYCYTALQSSFSFIMFRCSVV